MNIPKRKRRAFEAIRRMPPHEQRAFRAAVTDDPDPKPMRRAIEKLVRALRKGGR